MEPVRTKLAIPKEKCRTPQQNCSIPTNWYPNPSKLHEQLSEMPCCATGWLLSPAHPRLLLHLGDLSWLSVQLPFPAGLWAVCGKDKEGKWLCLQPEKAPCLTPTPSPSIQVKLTTFPWSQCSRAGL